MSTVDSVGVKLEKKRFGFGHHVPFDLANILESEFFHNSFMNQRKLAGKLMSDSRILKVEYFFEDFVNVNDYIGKLIEKKVLVLLENKDIANIYIHKFQFRKR